MQFASLTVCICSQYNVIDMYGQWFLAEVNIFKEMWMLSSPLRKVQDRCRSERLMLFINVNYMEMECTDEWNVR